MRRRFCWRFFNCIFIQTISYSPFEQTWTKHKAKQSRAKQIKANVPFSRSFFKNTNAITRSFSHVGKLIIIVYSIVWLAFPFINFLWTIVNVIFYILLTEIFIRLLCKYQAETMWPNFINVLVRVFSTVAKCVYLLLHLYNAAKHLHPRTFCRLDRDLFLLVYISPQLILPARYCMRYDYFIKEAQNGWHFYHSPHRIASHGILFS